MIRPPLLAAALASFLPPARAAEGRMEASLLDWTCANATTGQTPAPRAAAITHDAFPWEAERLAVSTLPEVLVAEESGRADKAALQEALEK
jgi:hypothetical protein